MRTPSLTAPRTGAAQIRHQVGLRGGAAIALLALLTGSAVLRAQSGTIPAPATPLVEAGVPRFLIQSPESLGLSAAPTDLHQLPDGRILVVAPEEIAIGDGQRWAAFRRAPDTDPIPLANVAVDGSGEVYASIAGAFARLDFGGDARWRFRSVAPFPAELAATGRVLFRVSARRGAWYWSAGSGEVVAWHPGRPPRVLGSLDDPEDVLAVGDALFMADSAHGALYRIEDDKLVPFDSPETRVVNRTLLCGVPLPDGRTLVGTYGLGAMVFDGKVAEPFIARGPLAGRSRILDLQPIQGGYYCAAVDNLGIVVFDAAGRTVQVLDRSVDYRLARVRRLLPESGGSMWALLNEGIAQFEVPARLTRFDSLIPTGLNYVQMCRHADRLWLVVNGIVNRGIYDQDGRLLRFEEDTPGAFTNTIATTGGRLVAATSGGIYLRVGDSWERQAVEVNNPHLSDVADESGRLILFAKDEVGWCRVTSDGITLTRQSVPGLGTPYGVTLRSADALWVELGTGRAARVVPQGDHFEVTVLGREDGFPEAWVQAFVVDGVARFNVAGRIVRYDPESGRIVPDDSFSQYTQGLAGEHGRPARDELGRLWIASGDGVHVLEDQPGAKVAREVEHLQGGLQPIAFHTEGGGIVWMHQRQLFVRYDPSLPRIDPAPLRGMISQVRLGGSDQPLHPVEGRPISLDHHQNSLTFHFMAPNTSVGKAVVFDVMLAGASDSWVPIGLSGVASFNNLEPGHYTLRVRPRMGAEIGGEATLAFSIRAPWHRTPAAYLAYGFGAVLLLAGTAAGWSHLARREKARLAHLVAQRTSELLGSEERYRTLSEDLERRVVARTAELNEANSRLSEANRELEAFSYSVSHDLRAPLRGIDGWSQVILEDYGANLDDAGRRCLDRVRAETQRLGLLIDNLLELSRTTRAEFHPGAVDLSELAASTAARVAATRPDARVEFICQPGVRTRGDSALLEAALFNLMDNAWKFSSKVEHPRVEFGRTDTPLGPAYFVSDNGAGFDMRHATKLFGVFQRMHTQAEFPGTGVGLANVQRIVQRHGGRIWAESTPNVKTTFFLLLPDADE